jgi:hypothetical protein
MVEVLGLKVVPVCALQLGEPRTRPSRPVGSAQSGTVQDTGGR